MLTEVLFSLLATVVSGAISLAAWEFHRRTGKEIELHRIEHIRGLREVLSEAVLRGASRALAEPLSGNPESRDARAMQIERAMQYVLTTVPDTLRELRTDPRSLRLRVEATLNEVREHRDRFRAMVSPGRGSIAEKQEAPDEAEPDEESKR